MPYLGKQPVNVIKDNAVSTNKIVDDAVTNAKVASSAINTTELADNAVHTAKINALAVTDAKLNDNAVTTNKIVDLNVTQGKLAAEAVSEAKLHAGNAPTNDYVLTAASGQPGGLIWSQLSSLPGGGNAVINSTTVAAAVPNVNFTLPISGYNYLLIYFSGVQSSQQNNHFRFRLSSNGGTSYDTIGYTSSHITNVAAERQSTSSSMQLNNSAIQSITSSEVRGFIRIHIRHSGAYPTSFDYHMTHNTENSFNNELSIGVGDLGNTSIQSNYCRFEFGGGNISQGKFVLYGVS